MAARFADRDGIFAIGDTAFPKKGGHSVGVGRQDCGAPGKRANCQCAISLHYVSPKGQSPLGLRLCLPDSWLDDAARLDRAGVPDAERRRLTRGQTALELLDRVRDEGLPCRVVVAARGYGDSGPFRDGLAERGLRYLVGVGEERLVVAETMQRVARAAASDRPRERHRPAGGPDRPESLKDLAVGTRLLSMNNLRSWTDEPMSGRFARLRVRTVPGWSTGPCAGAEPIGLLILEKDHGELECAFSDLPEGEHLRAVLGWPGRRWMEQDYRRDHGPGSTR